MNTYAEAKVGEPGADRRKISAWENTKLQAHSDYQPEIWI